MGENAHNLELLTERGPKARNASQVEAANRLLRPEVSYFYRTQEEHKSINMPRK
jgi:hypothetical protein